MKKIAMLAFVLILLLTAVVVGFIRPVVADETIYIWADGSIDPSTANITSADNVTYTFTDNIYDSIVVERDNIVVDGADYTLQGTGSGYGIDLSYRSNVTVKNMEIKSFGKGIWLNMSSSNVISGNTITANNDYGISIWHSTNNSVSGNSLTDNENGIALRFSSNFNSISGNNITNWLGHGIVLQQTTNNTLSANHIKNSNAGITLGTSSNNVICGNNITNNDWYGVKLDSSSNNRVYGNTIKKGHTYGIWLDHSSKNILYGNNITDNDSGIYLEASENIISGNTITNNGAGIYFFHFSNNNSVSGNNITNNDAGIVLWRCSNNKFCHNNFIDNTQQVNLQEPDYANFWDDGYPSGGNYWSNYTGLDLHSGQYQNEVGSDGIGDTSHDMDVDNRDGYPLMGPISFFNACTWDETTYYVHTYSNSTISDFYFSREDKLVSFNVTGLDGTVGFCRVTIPNELLWCYTLEEWNVTINGNPPTYLKAMEDADHTYLYFTYSHSIKEVQIKGVHVIPEFPTWTSMLLILILLTVAIAIYKRRLLKTPIH